MNLHFYRLLLCVPVFAGALSCSQREALPETDSTKEIVIFGAQEDFAGDRTRSVVGEILDNGALAMNWSVEDKIGVFGSGTTNNEPFTSTNTYPIRETGFKGNFANGETPEYAYYPYNASATDKNAIPVNIPAVQEYSDANSISQYDFKAAYKFTELSDGSYRFNMKQLTSLLRFEINLTDVGSLISKNVTESSAATLKSIKIKAGARLTGNFTYSLLDLEKNIENGNDVLGFAGDGDGGLTLILSDSPNLAGTIVAYAVVASGKQKDQTLDCELVINDYLSVKLSATILCDFEVGKFYIVPLNASVFANNGAKVEDNTPADPEKLTGQPANCYMITAANTYSFDATVIGNGDDGIIPDVGFHTTTSVIAPKTARLMWEDTEGFITNVSLLNGNVIFTAQKNVGNAQIAVYDGDGNVLWSWHIWGVGDTLPEDEVVTNKANATFTVMDRTLGALSKTSYYTTLYQWGRKDPFPNSTTYYVNGVLTEISDSYPVYTPATEADATLLTSVRNPDKILNDNAVTGNWNWLAADNQYLWGDNNTKSVSVTSTDAGAGWTNNKTIYDPCPSGYRVASKYTWTGFSETSTGSNASSNVKTRHKYTNYVKYENGYYFKKNTSDTKGCFYPMTGIRGGATGSLGESLNVSASYWASAPSSNANKASCLYMTLYNISTSSTLSSRNIVNTVDIANKFAAQPVRCVRDATSSGSKSYDSSYSNGGTGFGL